ncbi:MAG: peptide chain release factor N(5)-glutamine methyltransferase [Acidobacteria bacterium]|nr:peptide chain release factor N(5)-glutamine methyltransferase [Acidobacteriota bacterium]
MNVAEALALAEAALPRREGIPDPRREGVWLLARACGRSDTWVHLNPGAELAPGEESLFRDWLERRAAGEPAHHLTGRCPFWNREFLVTPAVLVPRPETELLVDAALRSPASQSARVLDVGTGSACIAATLALERRGWNVTATELSPEALVVARANLCALSVAVGLVRCDLAAALRGPFDLVTANLPYVPTADLAALPLEVQHDPPAALDGGADGLDLVCRLVADLPRLLAPCGLALLELGEGQADAVADAARENALEVVRRVRDLGGCDRIVVLQRAGAANEANHEDTKGTKNHKEEHL